MSDDGWDSAIKSVCLVLRSYAVMMENGETPMLRGPLALIQAARVIESTPRREVSECLTKE